MSESLTHPQVNNYFIKLKKKDQLILQIMHAESLDKLRDAMDRLTFAGCFHHVKSVEDRHEIVNDMLQWHVLERTRAVCERLLTVLSSL